MKTQNQIENYMAKLDRYLGHIPSTEKAEIILELNGHIQDKLTGGDASVEEVLKGLGTPEEVAKRYLDERGLEYVAPSAPAQKTETAKWLSIAFLGGLGMVMAFAIFIMIFFSPIVEVQEKEGKVRILGGLITVDEDMSSRGHKKKKHKEVEIEIEKDIEKEVEAGVAEIQKEIQEEIHKEMQKELKEE